MRAQDPQPRRVAAASNPESEPVAPRAPQTTSKMPVDTPQAAAAVVIGAVGALVLIRLGFASALGD